MMQAAYLNSELSDNPLVVFVVPSAVDRDYRDFPIGIGLGYQHSPVQGAESYSILFVDDEHEVPAIEFANKYPDKPLLIVGHSGSTENVDAAFDLRLVAWGRPYMCDWYSPLPTSKTWIEIKSVFSGKLTPKEFVGRRLDAWELELCSQLEAICEMGIIFHTVELENAMANTVKQLPMRTRLEVEICLKSAPSNWSKLLTVVQDHAAGLVRCRQLSVPQGIDQT